MPRQHWKEVAGLAEALLQGQPPLFEPRPDIQAAAEDIVAKLRARGFRAGALAREDGKTATVDLDTLEHENPRSVGCERLCLAYTGDVYKGSDWVHAGIIGTNRSWAGPWIRFVEELGRIRRKED